MTDHATFLDASDPEALVQDRDGRFTMAFASCRVLQGLESPSETAREILASATAVVDAARRKAANAGRYHVMDRSTMEDPGATALFMGAIMERTTALLEESTEEVRKAKKELEETRNQMSALAGTLLPELTGYLARIRDVRMAVLSETHQTLGALRDVRKFFVEKDYETEMLRLERFVDLCKELRTLGRDGTLDAVCASALKLAGVAE